MEKTISLCPPTGKQFYFNPLFNYLNSIAQNEKNKKNGAGGYERAKEVAIEFLSFLKVKNKLPDIEKILNEKIYEYPTDVDVLYALSTGLVSAYLSSKSSDRLENLITYSLDLQSEFAVMLIQDLQKLNIDMQRSKAFAQWVKKFAYLL